MATREILTKVEALKNEIDSFGKLEDAILKRIDYKFRLDWNYYSNSIEGNSLTRAETRSVMVNNINIADKPI